MIEELMNMVARAERHAEEIKSTPDDSEALDFYAPRYVYETSNQQALAGVA